MRSELNGEKCRGMRVLVTGGCGFIGSHVVEELLRRGVQVIAFDDMSVGSEANLDGAREKWAGDAGAIKPLQVWGGDITDVSSLARAMAQCTHVIHLAARLPSESNARNPLGVHSINATGTFQLLQMARRKGIARVVFGGTAQVYYGMGAVRDETSGVYATSTYTASKLCGEAYGQGLAHRKDSETEWVGLRYFTVYGPRQSWRNIHGALVGRLVESCMRKRRIPLASRGPLYDLIYVEDAAVLTVNALLLSGDGRLAGSIVNIGTGFGFTASEIITQVGGILGIKTVVVHVPEDASGSVVHLRDRVSDTTRMNNLLVPDDSPHPIKVCLDEGLQRTVSWLKPVIYPGQKKKKKKKKK